MYFIFNEIIIFYPNFFSRKKEN